MSLEPRRREALLALDIGEVRFDEPLSSWSRLGIGGPADALIRVRDGDAMALLKRWCRRERLPIESAPIEPDQLVRVGGMRGIVLAPPEGFEPTRRAALFSDPSMGVSASRLLKEAGVAGIRLRSVRIDDLDPNVVVNEGEGTAKDVLTLQGWLRERVVVRSGVSLESALRLVGRELKRG